MLWSISHLPFDSNKTININGTWYLNNHPFKLVYDPKDFPTKSQATSSTSSNNSLLSHTCLQFLFIGWQALEFKSITHSGIPSNWFVSFQRQIKKHSWWIWHNSLSENCQNVSQITFSAKLYAATVSPRTTGSQNRMNHWRKNFSQVFWIPTGTNFYHIHADDPCKHTVQRARTDPTPPSSDPKLPSTNS